MKNSAKLSLCFALGLFVLCLFSTVPVLAYSQEAGDEYTWEILVADTDPFSLGVDENDYIRLTVTAVNQTSVHDVDHGWVLADCVFGMMHTNSKANRTWELLYPTEILVAAYNSSYGLLNTSNIDLFDYSGDHLALNIIPDNSTAVNTTFYEEFVGLAWAEYSYSSSVISLAEDAVSVIGSTKLIYVYNSEGVLRDFQERNATGALWDTTFRAVLLIDGPNTFTGSIWPVIISGPVTIGLAVLYVYLVEWRKKE